jgi:hypothetical protein
VPLPFIGKALKGKLNVAPSDAYEILSRGLLLLRMLDVNFTGV